MKETNWKNNDGNVVCCNCGKDSGVLKSDSEGKDAAAVQQIGWQVKLPIYLGIAQWFFACTKECMKTRLDRAYEEHGVTEEDKKEAAEHLGKLKAKIPAMAKETAKVMAEMQKLIRSGYAGVMPGTGTIVDCRDHPEAVPVQKNELPKVPESKVDKKPN